jgi:hypothetical protein
LVFEPTGDDLESLFGNPDVLQLPIQISIARRHPLTTRMWENLFEEMNAAARSTDLQLYEAISQLTVFPRNGLGQNFLVRQEKRFVVTSVDRGSIELVGGILLAAGWAYKKFIEPGWEKSGSKRSWDDAVANVIDKAVPILRGQIDVRVVHRLKRIKIRRITLRRPTDPTGRRLNENTQLDTELVYDKPKQIEHQKKKIP